MKDLAKRIKKNDKLFADAWKDFGKYFEDSIFQTSFDDFMDESSSTWGKDIKYVEHLNKNMAVFIARVHPTPKSKSWVFQVGLASFKQGKTNKNGAMFTTDITKMFQSGKGFKTLKEAKSRLSLAFVMGMTAKERKAADVTIKRFGPSA